MPKQRSVIVNLEAGENQEGAIEIPANTRAFKKLSRIEQMRHIEKHGYKHIDRVLVDSFTASAYTQIWDRLAPENRVKLDGLPLVKAVDVVWKLARGKSK